MIILLIIMLILFVYLLLRRLDHFSLFLFGVLYYFIYPLYVGEYFDFFNIKYFYGWHDEFVKVGISAKFYFVIYCVAIVLVYKAGSVLSRRFFFKNSVIEKSYLLVNKFGMGNSSATILLPIVLLLLTYIWIMAKGYFFQGYSEGYNWNAMGKMATLNLLLLIISFMMKKQVCFFIKYSYYILFALNNIFLLSMGGRMYVLLSIIFALMFFKNSEKISFKPLFIGMLAGILMVMTGVLRSHSFSLDLILYMALAEPVFTSFSLFSFLTHSSNFHAFEFPLNFLNSFLLIMPNVGEYKSDVIISMLDMGYKYISPLGATSFFVSLLGNFGYLGGLFFIFFLGFLIETLNYSRSIVARVLYLMLCSILPFMLFRDAFGITVKVVFLSGFLIPGLIFIMSNMLKRMR